MNENDVNILVANPQVDETENLCRYFTAMGYCSFGIPDIKSVETVIGSDTRRYDLAFVDCEFLFEMNDKLFQWSEEYSTEIVVMSSSPTVESVINVLRMGVFDCLIRPFDLHELSRVVARVLERKGQRTRHTVCLNTGKIDGFDVNCNKEVVS